jgi:hypothetical protein
LFVAFQSPIFQYVKREEERKAEAEMKQFRYPTPEELYALEQWAHRERSKALAQMLKGLFRKIFSSSRPSSKTVRRDTAHA